MKKKHTEAEKKAKVDVKKIKNLLQNKALVVSVAFLVLTITGFIAYGIWQNVSTNAAGEDSLGAASRQYVVPVNSQLGCALAGRVWDAAGKSKTAEDEGSCKPVCQVNKTEYVKRDNQTKRPGYCKGHAHLPSQRFTPEYCIDRLHRVWLSNLGCARQVSQQDKNLAKRYCPNPAYPNYLTENNAIDKCIADGIIGAPRDKQPVTDGTSPQLPATNTQAACELRGRIWDGKKCTFKCIKDAGALLRDSTTKAIFCQRAVASIGEMGQQRCEQLHRAWLGVGCARRVDQKDVDKAPQCATAYPYYNANFASPTVETLTDVCEKDKRTSDTNEQNGILAGTPVKDDQPVNNDPDNDQGGNGNNPPNNPGDKRLQTTATFSFQNIGREERSATTVFQKIKQSLGDKRNIIYGFAEIDEGDSGEHAALRAVFGGDGWSGFNTRVPILSRLDNSWRLTGSDTVMLHNNTGNNTGPERMLVITKYEHTKSSDTKLAVANTHFVANAYNGSRNPRLKPYWDTAWAKVRDKVADLHGRGFDIVVTGDFNRKGKLPALHANSQNILASGPDSIVAIPAKNRKLSGKATGTIATPTGESFHKNIWARLTFTDGSNGNNNGNNNDNDNNDSNSIKVSDIKIRNIRDAATTTAKGKNVLKPGVLYRSAELSSLHVNDRDKRQLAGLLGKDATIIDVRTDRQVREHADVKIDGTNYKHIPIDGLFDQARMVTDPARRAQLKKVFLTAANADGDVLIHCVAGKDRTGWIVAMIMYTSGANDGEVMKEYMKSIEAWPGGVKQEWLNSGTSLAKKNYGSIESYLKRGVGLSEADLNKLRQKFKG